MHLCLALLFHRDYFDRPDASLTCSFAPQGLFRPAECISIWLFCAAGIISVDRIHPSLALWCRRDYFDRPDASLPSSFVPQGLFCLGQIRPPSLKPSLPGHSVKFKFDDLFGISSIKFGQQVIKTNTAIIILSV